MLDHLVLLEIRLLPASRFRFLESSVYLFGIPTFFRGFTITQLPVPVPC